MHYVLKGDLGNDHCIVGKCLFVNLETEVAEQLTQERLVRVTVRDAEGHDLW